jgi:hypothetical protein
MTSGAKSCVELLDRHHIWAEFPQTEQNPMSIKEALEDAEIAFRQLEFSIKLLSFCEMGNINPSAFDTHHLIALKGGNISLPPGNFSDQDSLVRAANIGVVITFGASVLALDQAFEAAGIKPDPASTADTVRLRTLVYMVRCAHAHAFAAPAWEVRGTYRRSLAVNLGTRSITVDLPTLHGQPFDIDQHLGGYPAWYLIRDEAVAALT